MSKKYKNVSKTIARLYEQAKDSLLLGTSDNLEDYLTLSLDTFDDIFPLFAHEDDETKNAIIQKTKLDIVAVIMLSNATQACYAGQYHKDEERDIFDAAGVLGYYAAVKEAGLVGGE